MNIHCVCVCVCVCVGVALKYVCLSCKAVVVFCLLSMGDISCLTQQLKGAARRQNGRNRGGGGGRDGGGERKREGGEGGRARERARECEMKIEK